MKNVQKIVLNAKGNKVIDLTFLKIYNEKVRQAMADSGGCKGTKDEYNGDYDCGYGTTLDCGECKYGGHGGRKDPEAKCNQPKP